MRKLTSGILLFSALFAFVPLALPAAEAHGLHGYEKGTGEILSLGGLINAGTVIAINSNGFTMKAHDDSNINVSTDGAKIIRIPYSVISLSNMTVGDKVSVYGNLIGESITALVVYDLEANKQPAVKKGTVTAVSGNSITVETKHSGTITVNTDSNTQVRKASQSASLADIKVGSKIGIFGLWDKVLNVLSAIKIKIKA